MPPTHACTNTCIITHSPKLAHTAMTLNYICPLSSFLNKRAEETTNILPEILAQPLVDPQSRQRDIPMESTVLFIL